VLCVQSLSLWINYRKLFPAKWYEKYLSPVYPAFGLLRHLFAWVRLLCLCHAVVVLSIGMEEMSSWLPAQAMKRFGFSATGPLPPSRSCVCHGTAVSVIPLKGEAERSLRFASRSLRFASLSRYASCSAWFVARPVPMSLGAAIQMHKSHWAGQGRPWQLHERAIRSGMVVCVTLVRW